MNRKWPIRRWLAVVVWALAFLAVAWAVPRIDQPRGRDLMLFLGLMVVAGMIWEAHEERTLRRSRPEVLAAAGRRGLIGLSWLLLFVVASLALGSVADPTPAETIADSIGAVWHAALGGFADPALIIALLALAFANYRWMKRRENEQKRRRATLLAQAAGDPARRVASPAP